MNDEQNDTKSRSRGVVGIATAAKAIKQLWNKEGPKHNAIVSLKKFARQLLKVGGEKAELAKSWLENKAGVLNAKRTEANIVKAKLSATATKNERRKKKEKKEAKTETKETK